MHTISTKEAQATGTDTKIASVKKAEIATAEEAEIFVLSMLRQTYRHPWWSIREMDGTFEEWRFSAVRENGPTP